MAVKGQDVLDPQGHSVQVPAQCETHHGPTIRKFRIVRVGGPTIRKSRIVHHRAQGRLLS
jgi:hypothetical protein